MLRMSPMSKYRKMAHVEISVFAHATEDSEKVAVAIRNLVPALGSNVELALTEMQGHHGNPILRLEAEMAVREDALEALDTLLSRLSSIDEDLLRREFREHLDAKSGLYLRFDKQQAFLGRVSLGSNDPISVRVRLGFQPSSLDELKARLKKERCAKSESTSHGQNT